jgi:erythromycin esterase-like protein
MQQLIRLKRRIGAMFDQTIAPLADAVHAAARPLSGARGDYDALIELIGEARVVLIGEASHGTHEFYRERARITRRLIEERGFTAGAVEADWPDAYRVNRYVRGIGDGATALDALGGFERFPTWMWRNADVLDFVGWLRARNDTRPHEARAGFYGLDLYSLYGSIAAVLDYLDNVDPAAAGRARYRYSCLGHFGEDSQAYGYAASFGMAQTCEDEVVKQLVELRERAGEYARRDGRLAEDEYFFAEQNARLIKNAEEYYRTMFGGPVSSWNLRDRHMAETLDALIGHLDRQGPRAKVVVWEHSSRLGDARATEMGWHGELNVGQLVRERYGADAFNVGFTTYSGTVTAAYDWDGPAERRRVLPALPGSFEEVFHVVSERAAPAAREVGTAQASTGEPLRNFMILPRAGGPAADLLREPRLERAIGVVYRPETERVSHYFRARLADQFDAVLHFDETRAVEPLDRHPRGEAAEPAETFPSGL